MSNEDLIEELLWIAYQKDLGIQLAELAGSKQKKDGLDRYDAYEKAFYELGLTH
jgi:hypothetical protein